VHKKSISYNFDSNESILDQDMERSSLGSIEAPEKISNREKRWAVVLDHTIPQLEQDSVNSFSDPLPLRPKALTVEKFKPLPKVPPKPPPKPKQSTNTNDDNPRVVLPMASKSMYNLHANTHKFPQHTNIASSISRPPQPKPLPGVPPRSLYDASYPDHEARPTFDIQAQPKIPDLPPRPSHDAPKPEAFSTPVVVDVQPQLKIPELPPRPSHDAPKLEAFSTPVAVVQTQTIPELPARQPSYEPLVVQEQLIVPGLPPRPHVALGDTQHSVQPEILNNDVPVAAPLFLPVSQSMYITPKMKQPSPKGGRLNFPKKGSPKKGFPKHIQITPRKEARQLPVPTPALVTSEETVVLSLPEYHSDLDHSLQGTEVVEELGLISTEEINVEEVSREPLVLEEQFTNVW